MFCTCICTSKGSQLRVLLWGYFFFFYYSLCSLFFPVGGLWPFVFSNLGYTNTISLIIRVKKRKEKERTRGVLFLCFFIFSALSSSCSHEAVCLKWTAWQAHNGPNWITRQHFFFHACCGDNPLLCEIARQCIQHYQASSAFFIYLFFVEMIMATLCKVQYSSVMLQSRRMRKDPRQAGF